MSRKNRTVLKTESVLSFLSAVMGEKSRRKVLLEITHKFTHLPRKFSARSPSSFIIMSNTARELPVWRIYIMLLYKYIYFLTQRNYKHFLKYLHRVVQSEKCEDNSRCCSKQCAPLLSSARHISVKLSGVHGAENTKFTVKHLCCLCRKIPPNWNKWSTLSSLTNLQSIHNVSTVSQVRQHIEFVQLERITKSRKHFFVNSVHFAATRGSQICLVTSPAGGHLFSGLWKVVQGRSSARRNKVLAGLRVEVRELWLCRVNITHCSSTVKIHAFFDEIVFYKLCCKAPVDLVSIGESSTRNCKIE